MACRGRPGVRSVTDRPGQDDPVRGVQSLFVQHMPALRGFVTSLVSDFAIVDDVIQETFMTVTAKAASYRPGTNFRAWLWTVARLKTLEALRASRARHLALSDDVIDALCAHESALEWDRHETYARHLIHCLGRLSPKAKLAVEMRYKEAHRTPEIASRMGWTINTVHVALSRARSILRQCVQRRLAAEGAGS